MTDNENAARPLPSRPIRVAAVNFAPVYGNKPGTLQRLERALLDASEAGVDLAIFPECALNGWFPCTDCGTRGAPCATHLAEGERIDGTVMTGIARRVRELGLHAMIGFIERDPDLPVLYNAAALIGPDGVIGVTRKVHLGRAGGVTEGMMCRSGEGWHVWDTALGPIGAAICFDIWLNPEVARILALKGAWLIAVPTASAAATLPEDLEAMALVRARENMVYVATANLVGDLGDPAGSRFMGHSVIAGPQPPRLAAWLAKSGNSAGMAIATLDPATYLQIGERVPWKRWRREELADASHLIAREFAAFAEQARGRN